MSNPQMNLVKMKRLISTDVDVKIDAINVRYVLTSI